MENGHKNLNLTKLQRVHPDKCNIFRTAGQNDTIFTQFCN
jgi:hypothetical protein